MGGESEHNLVPPHQLSTAQGRWRPLRHNVAAADVDTALNFASGGADWDDKAASVDEQETAALSDFTALVSVKVPIWANSAEILFYGSDAANEAATYFLYSYGAGGPASVVATGVATLGTADCDQDPVTNADFADGFYADNITDTAGSWNGIAFVDNGSDNRVAKVTFDLRGTQWLALYLTTFGSAATMGAAIRYF